MPKKTKNKPGDTPERTKALARKAIRRKTAKSLKTVQPKKGAVVRTEYTEDLRLVALDMFCRPMALTKIGHQLRTMFPKLTDRTLERWKKDGDWERVRANRLELRKANTDFLLNVDWEAIAHLQLALKSAVERATGKDAKHPDVFALQKLIEQLIDLRKSIIAPLEAQALTEAQRVTAVNLILSVLLDTPAVAKALADRAEIVGKSYADRLRGGGMKKAEADRMAEGLIKSITEGVKQTGTVSGVAAVAKAAYTHRLKIVAGEGKR